MQEAAGKEAVWEPSCATTKEAAVFWHASTLAMQRSTTAEIFIDSADLEDPVVPFTPSALGCSTMSSFRPRSC